MSRKTKASPLDDLSPESAAIARRVLATLWATPGKPAFATAFDPVELAVVGVLETEGLVEQYKDAQNRRRVSLTADNLTGRI